MVTQLFAIEPSRLAIEPSRLAIEPAIEPAIELRHRAIDARPGLRFRQVRDLILESLPEMAPAMIR